VINEHAETMLCCGNCMQGMGFPEVTCCQVFFLPTEPDFICAYWQGPEGQSLYDYPAGRLSELIGR
jgi:hypothetical protein